MGNSTNETKPYQVAIVGDSKYGSYAFHIEGRATQKPIYTEAKEGKKAYCHFGFAINDNAWRILGKAEGDENAYSDREDNVFMSVTAFGVTAERISKAVDKGALLMLSGKISHSVFKKRDGNEGESVLITANHFVVIDEGNNMPTSASGVLAFWNKKENHMLCGVCGYVKKVGEIQCGQTGERYLQVAVDTTVPVDQTFALANGTYSNEEIYNQKRLFTTIWGNRAIKLKTMLQPGMPIMLTGRGTMSPSANGDGMFYRLSANAVTLFRKPKDEGAEDETKKERPATQSEASKPETETAAEAAPEQPKRRTKKENPASAPQVSQEEDDDGFSVMHDLDDEEELELPF